MAPLYQLFINKRYTFFKVGQFICNECWLHKKMILKSDCEIMVGLNHKIHLLVNEQPVTLERGDALFIPPNVPFKGLNHSEEGASFFWLHFFPNSPIDLITEEEFANYLPINLNTSNEEIGILPQKFSLLSLERVVIMLKQILDISQSNYFSSYMIDCMTKVIVIELCQQYRESFLSKEPQNETKRMEDISNWIRVNIYNSLTVKDVADYFMLNPDYLTRMFKRFFEISTIQYINSMKISEVKQLLVTTDYTLIEIADQLNFNSEKYMMKLFKKLEGITPTQYRNSFPKTYLNTLNVDPDIPSPKK